MEKRFSVSENKTRYRQWVGPRTPHSHGKNKGEKYTTRGLAMCRQEAANYFTLLLQITTITASKQTPERYST